ncbi:response regulator transcription factor [Bacillus shivajii]|uniref:response regulator n=1 Tax=Bacillus shivajii TaxID=1983719 RepID=UPI001CFA3277|nr:response regulator transcription factor [Bacillus shivajii]UCZ55155.1 response regulator transcription factor [Bacillus shivajii]
MSIHIIVVDDHHVVRKGLLFFLEKKKQFSIIGEAANGKELLELLKTNQKMPDIILLDLSMPIMDGVSTTKELKKLAPEVKILILTSFEDEDHVISAIEAGADGYCLKDTAPDDLVAAIENVYEGKKDIDPKVATHLLKRVQKPTDEETSAIDSLTKREREVLIQIANGKNNKEISETLFITEKTVKTHITNVFAKLPVQDRTQAALFAVKHGLNKSNEMS